LGAFIGLTASYLALVFGCLFFLYAVKYYASTILALGALGREKVTESDTRASTSDGGRDEPFVSIHLPFYNEVNVARRVIKACLSLDYGNYEVLVVDDSRDETIGVLKEVEWRRPTPAVKFVHRRDRSGFKGGALSNAARYMDPRAEFVVVFDADFIPPQDILRRFVNHFREHDPSYAGSDFLPDYDAGGERGGKPVAAVQGYQLHHLNKSENWVTRGVRAEFSGSYMVERVAAERYDGMKMISGSVFMLRADTLRRLGWGTSITEDWELTLRLYLEGYRVVYTPLIQAPAEIPTTIRALTKQRMRWAEGHTYAVKRYFRKVLGSAKLTTREKLEFLYFSPYYLQPLFLLVGTLCWLVAEASHMYPAFWSPAFGWSLTLSNFLAVPLMGLAGIFLEGDLRADCSGVLSFVALSYIIAPFQAYAALKGLLEPEEGTWVRTLKTGSITDRVLSLKLRGIVDWVRLRTSLPRFGFGDFVNAIVHPFPVRYALMTTSMVLMTLPVLTGLSSLGFGIIGGGLIG
jgi:cellulose synthase/poly-beta-1,6-N-acetylglucosamine synthase-like glycosyltransferase